MTDEMTEEEKLAEEYVKSVIDVDAFDWKIGREIALAYIAGLEAGSRLDKVWQDYDPGEGCYEDSHEGKWVKRETSELKWHKVADGDLPEGEEYGKNSIHRNIYLKDRYGNLYTGNYYPKDETHAEDCFAVEVLEWGFQGSKFCKKGQIAEWCEIPQ